MWAQIQKSSSKQRTGNRGAELEAIDKPFDEHVADIFNDEPSVASWSAKGGASNVTVLEQLTVLQGTSY